MASIFSRIVARELPCYKVAESDKFLAFLDINPQTKGHTLVIPKEEIDYLFDVPEELYVELQQFARMVAGKIKSAIPCERVGVAVIGFDVPHAHIHLIPINEMDDMNFSRSKMELSPEEFAETAASIASAT